MSFLRPYMRRSYVHFGEQGYIDYFRKPLYRSAWFGAATGFFLFAFGHGLWILSRHWTANSMKYAFLIAVVMMMPLPWLRAIRQHSSLRGMVSKGLGLEEEVEKRLLKETASSSLFMLWQAYATINLILGVVFSF